MNVNTVDGNIRICDDAYGVTRPLTAYICKPNFEIICKIVGINKFDITLKANDISEINFEISRFYTNNSLLGFDENPAYKYLLSFNTIFIPEFGEKAMFRINSEPDVSAENTHKEVKSFTAYSYDSILQYESLEGFVVNCGTTTSLEMYSGNLDSLGAPIEKIKLYDATNTKLSLLHLVIANDYYGWSIDYVDSSIASLSRSFEISKQNIYSFLREDVSKAFECIFEFNTVDKKINVYAIKNYGNSTNILLSFERFVKLVDIKPQTSDIYTVFNVSGGNELNIVSVNYGSNKIVNADYATTLFDKDVYVAYIRWRDYREGMRSQYSEYYVEYTQNLAKQNAIQNREPESDCSNPWSSEYTYELDDLRTLLSNYQAAVDEIETLYTTSGGGIDTEALDESGDASKYYSYKYVCIPDIEAEIAVREADEGEIAETVDYDTMWVLYGITALETKLKSYQELVLALKRAGYNRSWRSGDSTSQSTWNTHYEEYKTYTEYVKELKVLIKERKARIKELKADAKAISNNMKALADSVSLETFFEDDTNGDYYVSSIQSVFKESDYQDNNYLITEYDDATSIVAEAELLYQAAKDRLEVEAHPQLNWSITTDNLFAIESFKPLRDEIQLGNYIYLLYGSEFIKDGVTMSTESGDYLQTEDGEYIFTESSVFNEGEVHLTGDYQKLRIIEIAFSGISMSDSFSLRFSDNIITSSGKNDFETLLGTYISSKTNSISAAATSAATTAAQSTAVSVVRPYIQANQMKITNAEISNAQIDDLTAINAKVTSLLADYVKADELNARVAEIGSLTADDILVRNLVASVLNVDDLTAKVARVTDLTADTAFVQNLIAEMITVDNLNAVVAEISSALIHNATIFDLSAGTISADKSITLVSRNGYGSITLNNAQMVFADENGDTRMVVGKQNDNYVINIYSGADSNNNQKLLWSSDGIEADAIADGVIVNRMLSDGSVTNAKISDLSAEKITTGMISSSAGTSYWNLDTGEVSINGYVINAVVQYANSNSPTVAPTSGWSTTAPAYESGKYMWQRTILSRTGSADVVTTTCIQGAKGEDGTSVTILGSYDTLAELEAAHPTGESGDSYMVGSDLYVWNGTAWEDVGQIQGPQGEPGADGEDAISMVVTSSNGTIFKDGVISTTLTAHVYKGGSEITDSSAIAELGTIRWYKDNSTSVLATGSTLTVSSGDVTNKAVYTANLEI